MSDIVIFHASCADGFCSAWVVRKKKPDAEFIAAHHGDEPPDVRGRNVVIVDFSYPRAKLELMKAEAKSLVVLDHHKTAKAELEGLDYCVFDMNKSGARLAQDFFFPGHNHWLVDYTEDRDLWKWELEDSKEINAALRSYPFDFDVWDDIGRAEPNELVVEGKAILRYQQGIVDSAVKNAREVSLDGHSVLSLNSTTLISEIAAELAKDRPFGVCWFERQDGSRVFSLRSSEGGIDVSEIAKRHGGGGHAAAAGFTVPPKLL